MAGPSLGPRAVDAGENPEPVMSSALGVERDLPWSEPVQINDPFEGEFVGVFDRHFFSKRLLNTTVRVEIQSLWTRNFIRVLSTVRDVDCFGYSAGRVISPNCSEFSNPRNITQLLIKVNDEILTLYRQGSTFPISESVAIALKNAPEEVISIRLISETGEIIDSEIGKGTVAAWKVVYGAGAIADSPASLQGGF
ncbi:MAG: hypothetical protein AAF889_01855 [Cyanobacteria bacterium P01_D01_bin.73]